MEIARLKMRECSVQLWRCDLDSRRSAPRAEGGVSAAPYEFAVPVASQASGHIQVSAGLRIASGRAMLGELIGLTSKEDKSQPLCLNDCTEMPMVVIKIEPDTEDALVTQEADAPMGSDVIKEEDDFIMKRGDEADELMVKQEPEIESTVLQQQAALRMPSPPTLTALDPRPTTSSGVGRASTPLCTVLYAPAKLRTEAKNDHCQGSSGFLPRASLIDSKRKEDFCQKISRKCSYDHSGNEDASIDRHIDRSDMGRSKCDIRSPSERNPKKDKTGACTGCKQCECHYCKYIAKKKSHLTNQTHKHMSQKLHKCKQCDYSSFHAGHLKAHMRTHTGEKPYKCEQCEYSASQVSHLKLHIRTHTGEKPYKCEQCEYSASQVSHLKKHMRTHTGEKPYKCEQCDYSASEVDNLKKHMRTHTGERPYKCEQCEYSASQIGNLKTHMRTHTGENSYKCEQ